MGLSLDVYAVTFGSSDAQWELSETNVFTLTFRARLCTR
jgi:hypothetical protein